MVNPTTLTERLLDTLRLRRVASSRELGAALGTSQPSISRALAAAGSRVVRVGQARRSRYAAVREVRGLGTHWPLYRIDERGQPREFGELTALHGDGCLVATATPPDWFQGEFADGLFPGLPWFLDDQRPQGFLGRQFAQRWSRELGLPTDVLRWNGDAVLTALLLHGDDAPGDFVLGDTALERALRNEPEAIPAAARGEYYAQLAQATLGGELVGSSAAGEQPKFTTCVREADDSLRHVIVKFGEPADAHPGARRWADLLVCEHLAAELLAEHGHASARTELVQSQGWLCLETTRFDRIGAHGRRGFVSLASWSDARDGERDDWAAAAQRMQQAGWISADALEQVRLRWWFGRLIANTDMHFGNLGCFLGDTLPLPLAPSYDMLPMLYRPASSGTVMTRAFDPPPPTPAALASWCTAASWAALYWQRVARHPLASDEFHRIADANHAAVQCLRQRFDTEVT
ncbi:type II toxin-antitoxin system HipA family toxin YjjJ [Rhodanobacter sp. DHB23]|uniref:type II toxin-antitoxin system HipA family toxin YjjJ n=1 Tax=Rhodanobacter sp. DHB23 TaxID=2775923 RepID=UPI0017850CE8|nr:type II toxin-antitoxin system HipA family toxin YjjJ [Rhodanobacter sp. DHB23]MBD8874569.1 type II toxin-antitoxin system HipA family toxin YjjJ [Rhodanobacter sp. DHB23]